MLHLGRRADRTEVAQLELDESAQARPDADDGIDAAGFGHSLGVIAASESHGVEREPPDRHLAAQMVGVGADLPDVVDAHVANEEVRPRILGTARLEHRELERELAREDLRRNLCVNPYRGHGSLPVKPLAHDPVEPLDEVRNAIDRDREPCRHRVAAVLDEDVVAFVERLGDVNAGDRAARALAFVAVDRDDDRGPSEVLDEPRRAEADDAGGPLRIRDDGDPRIRSFRRALARTRDHLARQLLPLGVALLEPFGEELRFVGILGKQEAQRVLGIVDPTGCVQAGAKHEADVARADASELQTRAFDESTNAEDRRTVQGLETELGEYAVPAAKRDDVGDRRKRAELQQLVLPQGVREFAEEPLGEHERDTGARELLVSRRISRATRVDDRVRVRELGWRVVMVCDDEIDAELARQRRLFHGRDAAVDADDDLGAIRSQRPERRRVQAVTLLVAIGDVRTDHDAELPERAHQNGRTRDAVDVVVPVDDDALASRERTTDPLDRTIQIEHRRTLFSRPRRQEGGHVAGSEAAASEHLSDERGDTIRDIPGLFGHDPAPLRREGHLPFKYLARVFTLGLAMASCTPAASPSPAAPTSSASTTQPAGLPTAISARLILKRSHYVLPDGLFSEPAAVVAEFGADPTGGSPLARLRPGGREKAFLTTVAPNALGTTIDLAGLVPGTYSIDLIENVRGQQTVVATTEISVSAPEYVVWTLDFEGDASSDQAMTNTAAIADEHKIPMTIMWNPRVWTTTQVSRDRADAMQQWMTTIAGQGMAEIALHVHMWTDFVHAAGVTPRTAPNWAGRSDGYDVPITAFSESETRTLIDYSLKLMADHGLPRPTSFRAGGEFANAANLRAVAAAGFTADCSGVPAGAFGRLPLPWTLPADAQPYRPSADDANAVGSLPLLEVPTIGGNTYGYDVRTIAPIIRADLSYLAPAGQVATTHRAVTIVSHPGTITATESEAITALFSAFAPLRYDRDAGPVRFVTLAQLTQAWR